MITSTLKKTIGLAALLAVLSGCSSTSTTDEDAAAAAAASAAATAEAAASAQAAEDAAAAAAAAEAAVVLDSVFYFEFDQSTLSSDSRAVLMAHAAKLQEMPTSIRLEGHADERGTREYNMALGERRANSVRDFLVLQGVDGSMIETISYGEESPASMGSGESSYSENRRVKLK